MPKKSPKMKRVLEANYKSDVDDFKKLLQSQGYRVRVRKTQRLDKDAPQMIGKRTIYVIYTIGRRI